MNTEVMFSSEKQDWETPQDFYERLKEEFEFTLDPASTVENHKCKKIFYSGRGRPCKKLARRNRLL